MSAKNCLCHFRLKLFIKDLLEHHTVYIKQIATIRISRLLLFPTAFIRLSITRIKSRFPFGIHVVMDVNVKPKFFVVVQVIHLPKIKSYMLREHNYNLVPRALRKREIEKTTNLFIYYYK